MAFETTVNVEYKHRDGWHVFTSQDALGLYVASKDARTAYEDVPGALKMLMELDYSCQCNSTIPASAKFRAPFRSSNSRKRSCAGTTNQRRLPSFAMNLST